MHIGARPRTHAGLACIRAGTAGLRGGGDVMPRGRLVREPREGRGKSAGPRRIDNEIRRRARLPRRSARREEAGEEALELSWQWGRGTAGRASPIAGARNSPGPETGRGGGFFSPARAILFRGTFAPAIYRSWPGSASGWWVYCAAGGTRGMPGRGGGIRPVHCRREAELTVRHGEEVCGILRCAGL